MTPLVSSAKRNTNLKKNHPKECKSRGGGRREEKRGEERGEERRGGKRGRKEV